MTVAALVLEASIRATPLLGAVLVCCLLARRGVPALRHLALTLGLFAFLGMPALSWALPRWPLPVPRQALGLFVGSAPIDPARASGGAPGVAAGGAPTFDEVAAFVWALGAAVLLARIALGMVGAWRLRRRALNSGRVYSTGRTGRVRVALTEVVEVPMTVGMLRPTVLIPACWREKDRRRAALAHELCHVRRGDPWIVLLASLVCALHWPNPLVWLARVRLRTASEEACDDAVLGAGVPALEYAQLLVDLARRRSGADRTPVALWMARQSGISGRIRALLSGRRRAFQRRQGWALAAVLVLTVGCVAAANPRVKVSCAELTRHFAARYDIDRRLAKRIVKAAAATGLDPVLGFALVKLESDFRSDVVSPTGAVGLTQVLPTAAERVEPGITAEELHEPETNLRIGFRILGRYEERFDGDRQRALLAYRVGPGRVGGAVPDGDDLDRLRSRRLPGRSADAHR